MLKSTNDPVWRRLQNIFKRHQEEESGKVTKVETELQSPNEGTTNLTKENSPRNQMESTTKSESINKRVDETGYRPPVIEHGLGEDSFIQSGENSIGGREDLPNQDHHSDVSRQGLRKEREPNSGANLEESVSQRDDIQGVHNLPVTKIEVPVADKFYRPGQEPEPLSREASKSIESHPLKREQKSSAEMMSAQNVPGEVEDHAIPNEFTYQTSDIERMIPLEAAWPVQTRPMNSIEKDGVLPEDRRLSAQLAPIEDHEVQTSRQEVVQILQTIAPADQTSSSIEVITPRQKKPKSIARKGEKVSRDESQQNMETEQLPSQFNQSVETNKDKPTPVSPSVKEVPTEIGLLPDDLWKLIDEPVPPIIESRVGQPSASDSEGFGRLSSRRDNGGTDSGPEYHNMVSKKPITGLIQRQPTEITGRAEATGREQELTVASENQIEELARRVYSEVRRKLQVEWERIRHS